VLSTPAWSNSAGPSDPRRHRRVTLDEIDARCGVGDRRAGSGLFAGQDIAVGDASQHADFG
jgi:hypothetical protein